MRGTIEEAQPCTLVTVVYRDGSPRLWPIKFPKDGEHDNEAWMYRARGGQGRAWRMGQACVGAAAYQTRDAKPGYAPDPDFSQAAAFQRARAARRSARTASSAT